MRSSHFHRLLAGGKCLFFFLCEIWKSTMSEFVTASPAMAARFPRRTRGLALGRTASEDEPLNRILFYFCFIFLGNTPDCVFSLLQTSAEKSLVRSAAFKPVAPRSALSTETGHNSLDRILCPLEKARNPDKRHKLDTFSGLSSICLFFLYFIDSKVPRFVSNGRIVAN